MLIGSADDLEEQFGPHLGEGNISKFIDDQKMKSLELFMCVIHRHRFIRLSSKSIL